MVYLINRIKCFIFGHVLTTPSICNTLNPSNWLKKCDRCGRYIMHSGMSGLSISMTEKEAFKIKREFEAVFPYSIKEEEHVQTETIE